MKTAALWIAWAVTTAAGVYWALQLQRRVDAISSRCPPAEIQAGTDRYCPPAITWLCDALNSEIAVMPPASGMWVRCSPVATNALEVQVHVSQQADAYLSQLEARSQPEWVDQRVRSLGWQGWLHVTDRIVTDKL